MASVGSASSRPICNQPCHQTSHPGRVLSQQPCRQLLKSNVSQTETHEDVFLGSCTPTLCSLSKEPLAVPLVVPELPELPALPAAGQIPAVSEVRSEPELDNVVETIWEPEQLPESESKVNELSEDEDSSSLDSDEEPATTPVVRKSYDVDDSPRSSTKNPMNREQMGRPSMMKPVPLKRYFMALPQHKEFSSCSPCRYSPSPIMDENGNVFCPGQCGCCQCPWKRRSFSDNREHVNVKVCRCVQRGTIFSSFEDRETCSQTSYFDFCPCREKAEAKYLELYHREMWSSATATRGPEIQLNQIKELTVPPPPPQ